VPFVKLKIFETYQERCYIVQFLFLAEYTGVRTFEVYSDYAKGCMDDIRLEGKHLPLPPALNGTQWGQATMARNLQRNCPSNDPCANVICPK